MHKCEMKLYGMRRKIMDDNDDISSGEDAEIDIEY